MISTVKFYAALAFSVWAAGCMQTFEEDIESFNQIADRCTDSRLNRPIVSVNSNGGYSAQPVNTQEVGCASAKRTFEIIEARGE